MPHSLIVNDDIASAIVNLVRAADEQVYLVSPYISLEKWNSLFQEIMAAGKRRVEVNIYFRSDKLEDYDRLILQMRESHARFYTVKNLHTKLYLSEKECIVTSMNLLDSSALNAEEFAFHTNDRGILRDVTSNYIPHLNERAKDVTDNWMKNVSTPSAKPQTSSVKGRVMTGEGKSVDSAEKAKGTLSGHCIRCKKQIPHNTAKPFCLECSRQWKLLDNKETVEQKYCHSCGKPHKSSYKKPLCMSCWKTDNPPKG